MSNEIKSREYDVIGISSIIPNLLKVRRMCRSIRKYQPGATIVVGGHVANMPDAARILHADHIVCGDGVRWMRRFLGEDEDKPIRHPVDITYKHSRIMGVPLRNHDGLDYATLIPSVGCPLGCNFCSTSAMFGGKGKYIEFYETGAELFEIMCALESSLHVHGFFVMDENFLLDRKRALQLLDLMEKHGKAWYMAVFSSANVLRLYTMEQLVGLGVNWVWIGLEGKQSQYSKLAGTDTGALVRELHSHGIRVLGSSIIGLEEHTPENIDEVIDYAVSYNTDMHQFMLYMPFAGHTPVRRTRGQGHTAFMFLDFPWATPMDSLFIQLPPPAHQKGAEAEFLLRAFKPRLRGQRPQRGENRPHDVQGWRRYKDHPNQRVRARFEHEASNLPNNYTGALWAAQQAIPSTIPSLPSDLRVAR